MPPTNHLCHQFESYRLGVHFFAPNDPLSLVRVGAFFSEPSALWSLSVSFFIVLESIMALNANTPSLYDDFGPLIRRTTIAMVCLSGVSLCGRLYARRLSNVNFWWDDYLAVAGLVQHHLCALYKAVDLNIRFLLGGAVSPSLRVRSCFQRQRNNLKKILSSGQSRVGNAHRSC